MMTDINTPMTMTTRMTQYSSIQTEAKELFQKKNTDYGDAFATYGTVGILVRIGDKIQRSQSITNKGINLVEDEKLRDTLIDLHNYAAMGIMLLDENSEEPTIESNDSPDVNIWEVKGSQGFCYERQRFIDPKQKQYVETCSCPSFKYCKRTIKTCKHIEENADFS